MKNPPRKPLAEIGGFRITSVRTIWALGCRDEGSYRNNFFHRLSQFLRVLFRSFPNLIFDLRILFDPLSNFSQGQIYFAILARPLSGDVPIDRLLSLLHGFFEEYEAETLKKGEVKDWLSPFPFRHGSILLRKCRWVLFGEKSQSITSPLGFRPSPLPFDSQKPSVLWWMSSFSPDSVGWETVTEVLLRQEEPFLLSVRCQPTSLTEEEREFLQKQLIECETLSLTETRPTLRDQAKAWQKHLFSWWQRLEDASALLTVSFLSPKPIHPVVYQTLGALMSRFPTEGENLNPLGNGWDVYEVRGEEKKAFAESAKDITIFLPPLPEAPKPAQRLPYLFEPKEASAVFLLLPSPKEPLTGISCQAFRVQPIPFPFKEGVRIGVNRYRGITQPVCLLEEDLKRHVYIVGQTGTGKTTLLQTMILHLIRNGKGVCVIDPHGDLFRQLIGKIPKERLKDVVIIDPSDTDFPVGINLLECPSPEQRYFVSNEVTEIITRLMEDEYGEQSRAFTGPMFHRHVRMNLLLVMSDPDEPGTLVQFYNIFQSDGFWRRWIPLKLKDHMLERWVEEVLPRHNYLSFSSSDGSSFGDYVISKFTSFIFDPKLRLIFGQRRSTFDIYKAMNEGKIVLVNLSKGLLGITNSRFFGMVFLTKLYSAAMERAKLPEGERRDYFIFVDEFHAVATNSFINLLSEGRKFGVNLILANQFLKQIQNHNIMEGILGNVGILVCFRLGLEDAEVLEKEFLPVFHRFDLMNLPNWTAIFRGLREGQRVKPFTFETEIDQTQCDEKISKQVREFSRNLYGRPREDVEREIQESLEVRGGEEWD